MLPTKGEGDSVLTKGRKVRFIDKGPVLNLALIAVVAEGVLACTPTVRVEAPREPITINLNVRLDADVRVRLEEQAREDIRANPGIF
jgi:hypothetical protein